VRHFLITQFVIALVPCVFVASVCADEVAISPDQLCARMAATAAVRIDSIEGRYVRRAFLPEARGPDEVKAEVEHTLAQMEAAHATKGRDDLARFQKQKSDLRTSLVAQFGKTSWASVENYHISGNEFRIDRHILKYASMASLLKDETALGEPPETCIIWDGSKSIQTDNDSAQFRTTDGNELSGVREIIGAIKPGIPQLETYGRDFTDSTLIDELKKGNYPIIVREGKTTDGEDSLTLQVGHPGTVGFYSEITVLPSKGYVQSSAFIKVGNVVISKSDYSGYVEASPGIWIPTRIVLESRRIGPDGVPMPASELELVALGLPKINVALSEDLFQPPATQSTIFISDLRINKSILVQSGGVANAASNSPQWTSLSPNKLITTSPSSVVSPDRSQLPLLQRVSWTYATIFICSTSIAVTIVIFSNLFLAKRRRAKNRKIC
jgi:hypothetical protein